MGKKINSKTTIIDQTEDILKEYKNNENIIQYFDEQIEFEKAKVYMRDDLNKL
jgi:hypothetical protein